MFVRSRQRTFERSLQHECLKYAAPNLKQPARSSLQFLADVQTTIPIFQAADYIRSNRTSTVKPKDTGCHMREPASIAQSRE